MTAQFKKRHYQTIAQAMQSAVRDIRAKEPKYNATDIVDGVNYAIDWMCDTFKRDNPAFNEALFRAACEPGANVRARTVEGAAKATGPLTARLAALRSLPAGVEAVALDDPAAMHSAIAKAVGEG